MQSDPDIDRFECLRLISVCTLTRFEPMQPTSKTVAKQQWFDTMIGLLLGGALGWLLQQGTSRLSLNELVIWCGVFALVVGVVFYMVSPYIRQKTNERQVSLYGMVMSIVFLVVFIVPMSLTGAVQAKLYHIPAPIRNQYRISCLFTHASSTWDTAHYEVRLAGQLRWKEGPLEGYFDLDIFGYRSRFNRIVGASRYKNKQGQVYGKNKIRLEEMAHFIADRWATLNPDDPLVQEVRFKRVRHKTGGEHCMKRERWSRPALADIPTKQHDLLHTVRIKHDD